MMQTIVSLKEGDWVEEIYLVTAKQVSTAKNGVIYLSLKLADKTGEIDGKLWDNADEVARRFEREDFVRIKGITANYQGTMQIKMKTLEKVEDAKVDIANFIQTAPRNPEDMVRELRAMTASIANMHLSQLVNAFLNDTAFMELFKRTPAAKTLHHNYVGGLLEHVVELVSLARDVAKHFPSVDVDLLTVGAFLHDIGKVRELGVRKSIEYTTEGRLIGHISLGYEMIVEKMKMIPGFPSELAMLLKHIMLSHHGEYEFGSPKRPKIQEAIIINYLDDLSAKINNFQATLRKENVGAGEWTAYSKMHDRYLYRQTGYAGSGSAPAGDLEDAEGAKHVGKKSVRDERRGLKGNDAPESSGKLPLDI
jgi:3'-5' exoribonuclease